MSDSMVETFGEPISVYTRAQAIEDGYLVDLTEWASAEKGFHGGFRCPVAVTRQLWNAIEEPHKHQDTRGRAHDVLFVASLAARQCLSAGVEQRDFTAFLSMGRTKRQVLRVILDGDGVTIGFREDEGW